MPVPMPCIAMSEIDRIFQEREARRAAQARQRREHFDVAAAFLAEFHDNDVAPSQALAAHGLESTLNDNRLLIYKSAAGFYADAFQIAIGPDGEIDAGGRSLGRYTPDDKVKLRRELTEEILTFFDL